MIAGSHLLNDRFCRNCAKCREAAQSESLSARNVVTAEGVSRGEHMAKAAGIHRGSASPSPWESALPLRSSVSCGPCSSNHFPLQTRASSSGFAL
jgi:hypothetical protein